MKPFDPTKPCQTRDGRKVRILCTDAPSKSGHPILGVIEGQADNFEQWTSDGKYYDKQSNSIYDLINIAEKRKLTGFVNVYQNGDLANHESKLAADQNRSAYNCVACLDLSKYNIEFEEGEGL